MKLSTDRHEPSRGLSVTAEPLVSLCYFYSRSLSRVCTVVQYAVLVVF